MTNLIEDQVLQSNFSAIEYAQIESNFNSITNHVDILCNHIQEAILPFIKKGNFLDIGSGPGFITRRLYYHFAMTFALDPNENYAPYFVNHAIPDRLRFINKNFESMQLNNTFDFILCSHVLYHISQNQWPVLIPKICKLLAKEGKVLFTLVAPRGNFHELCSQVNPSYSNSRLLQHFLKKMSISYETTQIVSSYAHEERQELHRLLRMFVIDDCFSPEEYTSLSDLQVQMIDQHIASFIDNCYDKEKKIYGFNIEEDYICL